MKTFFMLGKYSPGEVRNIAAHRTEQLREVVSRMGGKVIAAYALLGQYDLVLIVELPTLENAMKTAVALGQLFEISFRTSAAVPIDVFDNFVEELTTEIESSRMEAGE
jgi:uncharacterized protein with GYD domain